MKKIVILLAMWVTSSYAINTDTTYVVEGVEINTKVESEMLSSWCDGFKAGYIDGFCFEKIGCVEPITPVCPVRGLEYEDSYKGGYGLGFIMGYEER